MAWLSIIKTAACLIIGGAIMGLLRGSASSGALAGLFLFGLFLAVALAVIAVDGMGRWRTSPPPVSLSKQEREAA
jgi:hypothetical protein